MRTLFFLFFCFLQNFANAQADSISTKKTILICIDPGHGGFDPGNEASDTNIYLHEKDLNLRIAKKVGNYLTTLQKGIEICYTREKDEFISLENRANYANLALADIFISIHCNSNELSYIKGTQTHIHNEGSKLSKKLAHELDNQFGKRAGRETKKMQTTLDRGYNLYVLQYTKMTSVLIEVGFMSNPEEEKYLNSEYGQDIIASAIYRALRNFIKENL